MTEIGRSAVELAPVDHAVQLYKDEADLFAGVADFVSGALDAGEVALLIATWPHLAGFEAELQGLGVEVTGSLRDGRIIMFDAASVMARVAPAGRVDADAFTTVIGGAVRRQLQAGRRLRIYGEVVSLLWDGGHVVAAIELEALWNELGRELPFSLLCGYGAETVLGAEQATALAQMCGLHSHVVEGPVRHHRSGPAAPGAQVSARFPAAIGAPRLARHLVVGTMRRWGFAPDDIDDAALVATELAANAVVHAASAFSLVVRVEDTGVRITVRDDQPVDPTHLIVRPGRGLGLVERVSRRWGAEMAPHGKAVWAELAGGS
jgi:hypothetical protein